MALTFSELSATNKNKNNSAEKALQAIKAQQRVSAVLEVYGGRVLFIDNTLQT